jgi:hypothetical protein
MSGKACSIPQNETSNRGLMMTMSAIVGVAPARQTHVPYRAADLDDVTHRLMAENVTLGVARVLDLWFGDVVYADIARTVPA